LIVFYGREWTPLDVTRYFAPYYDIELRGRRSAGDAGGTALITTTIVAQNRIFVPVPEQLMECFHISSEPMEFFVRFDVIARQ
jgi:molecular chaperone HtpG